MRDDGSFGGPAPPAATFYYSRDRGGEHPQGHLAGYGGIFQADAYAGYTILYDPQAGPARRGSILGARAPAVLRHSRCRFRCSPQGRGQDHQRGLAAGAGESTPAPQSLGGPLTVADIGMALLLWAAVLFVIFQTPSIRCRLLKSIHPSVLPDS